MKPVIQNIKLLLIVITILTAGCSQPQESTEPVVSTPVSTEPANATSPKTLDKNVLLGDWVRTDADYRIQVSEVLDNEQMKAGYFNPRSINVDKALWALKDGRLQVYIELRDENYPGSSYALSYIPERDLLAGTYFQAVEGNTYDVGFVRKK